LNLFECYGRHSAAGDTGRNVTASDKVTPEWTGWRSTSPAVHVQLEALGASMFKSGREAIPVADVAPLTIDLARDLGIVQESDGLISFMSHALRDQFVARYAVLGMGDSSTEAFARQVAEIQHRTVAFGGRQSVTRLGVLRGDTAADIAKDLDVSPVTVRTRLVRVRAALRAELAPFLEERHHGRA
jgi:hypothetical protein